MSAIQNSDMSCHLSDVAKLYIVEFREGWVGRVIVFDHSAVICQPNGVTGSTLFQHFDDVFERNRRRHLRCVSHRNRVCVRDIVARSESSILTIQSLNRDL